MNDKEPTQEQIKEFWEWCGFTKHQWATIHVGGDGHIEPAWVSSTGACGKLPEVDLNNLFKYAVPKLDDMGHHLTLRSHVYSESLMDSPDYEASYLLTTGKVSHNSNPALALFWAIYQVALEP